MFLFAFSVVVLHTTQFYSDLSPPQRLGHSLQKSNVRGALYVTQTFLQFVTQSFHQQKIARRVQSQSRLERSGAVLRSRHPLYYPAPALASPSELSLSPGTTLSLHRGEGVQILFVFTNFPLYFFNLLTAEEHEDSRTKDDSIPEKSSDCLTEDKVKKRRVRKKKPRKQDSEYGKELKDTSETRENTDTKNVGEEVKVTKRRNKAVRSRGHGVDNGSYRPVNDSENPDIPGHVKQKKCSNSCHKGLQSSGPDMENAPSRRVNDGEVTAPRAGSVENVKYYVKRRNKVVGNCVRVDVENNLSRRIPNSKTHEEVVPSRVGNVRGDNTDKEVKDVRKASKVVTPRSGNDLGNNFQPSEGVRILKRRNKIVSSSCTNEVDESLVSSSCSLKEGVDDIERPEKVVDSRNVDDSGENPGAVKEAKHVKILKRGQSSSSVGDSVCIVLDQNKGHWGHVTPCNRNRPSQGHNRDDSYATDVTHVGVTQRCNATEGVTWRRRSFSNEITKDSTGMERNENASGVESTQEYAESRSPGNFSRDVPKRGWEKSTRTSAAIGKKLMKDNHRRVYTTPRRRSFDHKFEKNLEGRDRLENQRPCPSDSRSQCEKPENPEREPKEDETVTNLAELSSGTSKTICIL